MTVECKQHVAAVTGDCVECGWDRTVCRDCGIDVGPSGADGGSWVAYAHQHRAPIRRRERCNLGHQHIVVGSTSPGAVPQWQPIETAPKDGTPVLAWDEGAVCIVTWVSGDSIDPDGWYDVRRLDPAPTHWQPLPAPPLGVPRG